MELSSVPGRGASGTAKAGRFKPDALCLAIVAGLIFTGLARAEKAPSISRSLEASYVSVGQRTLVPHGWLDFCSHQPAECAQGPRRAADIKLTPAALRDLEHVNRFANKKIEPVSNFEHWGTMVDHWDYPNDGKGDCKVYALYKRKLLMQKGYPRQALLMTIVRDLNGEGHTILTVKTDRGDLILDNLNETIVGWEATGYRFMKRQSQEDPNVWVGLSNQRAENVAAQ